jgi:two-component system NarL family response regulator
VAKIKVLLIEDNRLLRDGTAAILNEQEDIVAVSSAGNKSALDKARKLALDVVLLDVGLKSQSSMKVLESIKKQHPQAEVIVMDLIPSHSEVVGFVEAGVSGFITKDDSFDSFLNTIRSVVKGVRVLPPTMADSLFSKIVESAVQAGKVNRVKDAVKLTKREREIVEILTTGKSITEVSKKLKIAVFTVKNHIRSILDKLALHTRLELAAFAGAQANHKSASMRPRKGRN